MLMRRLLMSTVICSGLVFAAGSAYAVAPPQTFQPNTAWAVTKIEAKSSGGGAYCALARRFTGDMIVTFARNARDESSLAIDFQKDLLKTNDTYFVTLKPGSGQDRMFEVKPVSGKAMVIRLGQDFAFYDALSRAGNLKVDISGQVYEFNMPDMAQGQSELNGCLANLVQPAAGGSDDVVPVAPPSSSAVATPPSRNIADVPQDILARDARTEKMLAAPARGTSEIIKAPVRPAPVAAAPEAAYIPPVVAQPVIVRPDPAVMAEVESLREENMRLKNAMERERRNFEDRFMQQSAESSKASEVNEKLRLLEMENESLRANLNATAALPKPPPVTNDMMDKLRLLETENAGLRKTMSDMASQPVVAAAPMQCETGNTAQMSDMTATLKAELTALRDENGRLKLQMADQTARLASLEQQASSAMLKAETAVRADNGEVMAQMQSRVAQLEEENAILRTKVKTQHVDAAPGEGIITLTQLRSVESQLQVVQADRNRLAQQIEDIQKGKGGDLLAKAAGNWDLEEATRRFNEAEREIRRLGGQLEQERSKCAADVKRIEYMMFDPSIATKEQTAKLLKLEEEVMSFNANTEVQGAAYKSRIQTLEKTVTEKDAQLQDVQQRIAAVEGKLTEKDNAIREGQKKIVALEQTIASNGTGSLEATQKLAALEKTLAVKDTELKTLQASLAGLQQKYASIQQEAVSKDSQLKVTTEKLAAAQQTVDSLQARTQTQVAQQQALSDKQKAELVAAQAQLAELSAQQAQLERAKAEIATLSAQQDELTRAQQQIAQLTAERAQLEQARAQVAQLSNEKQQLLAETAKIAQLTAEKNALKAEAGKVAVLESEMGALAAAKAQAEADRAEMAKLAGERATLLQRVAALEADKDAMEKALSGMAPAAGGAPQIAAAIPTGGSRAVSSFAHAQEANVTAPSAIQTAAVEQQRIVPRDAVIKAEPLAPQMPRGPQAAAPMALAPAVEAATTGGTSLMDSNAVTRLLQQAGIQAQGGVQTEKTSAQMVSYSWDTGTVYGTAEQQPMGGMGQFETMVQAYLSKTGERCTGDFGAIPGMTEDRDGARVATYEIACIMPDGAGASAAIVFHAQDGLFTAIAHEAAMDGMDIAMDVRDAVFTSLLQTKLASR